MFAASTRTPTRSSRNKATYPARSPMYYFMVLYLMLYLGRAPRRAFDLRRRCSPGDGVGYCREMNGQLDCCPSTSSLEPSDARCPLLSLSADAGKPSQLDIGRKLSFIRFDVGAWEKAADSRARAHRSQGAPRPWPPRPVELQLRSMLTKPNKEWNLTWEPALRYVVIPKRK